MKPDGTREGLRREIGQRQREGAGRRLHDVVVGHRAGLGRGLARRPLPPRVRADAPLLPERPRALPHQGQPGALRDPRPPRLPADRRVSARPGGGAAAHPRGAVRRRAFGRAHVPEGVVAHLRGPTGPRRRCCPSRRARRKAFPKALRNGPTPSRSRPPADARGRGSRETEGPRQTPATSLPRAPVRALG